MSEKRGRPYRIAEGGVVLEDLEAFWALRGDPDHMRAVWGPRGIDVDDPASLAKAVDLLDEDAFVSLWMDMTNHCKDRHYRRLGDEVLTPVMQDWYARDNPPPDDWIAPDSRAEGGAG